MWAVQKLLANLKRGTYTEVPVMHIGAWNVYASVHNLFVFCSQCFLTPFLVFLFCCCYSTTILFVFSLLWRVNNGKNLNAENVKLQQGVSARSFQL